MEMAAASLVSLLMITVAGAHRRAGEPMMKALPMLLGCVLAALSFVTKSSCSRGDHTAAPRRRGHDA
jgi:hypothetical protein